MYYKTCPYCGANLDPNEDCDCLTEKKRKEEAVAKLMTTEEDGQLVLREAVA